MMEKLQTRRVEEILRANDIENIRELLEMLMSEHTPVKHSMKMKTSLGWEPAMDVFETDTEFVVVMDIAGMDRKDISVSTDGKVLRISGVRKEMCPGRGRKQFHSLEIQVGPFQRLIAIPVDVNVDSVSTNYSDGLLEVRMQRRLETPRKRRIDVD